MQENALMNFGNDKPKAKPPARLAQKAKPKEQEEEGKLDEDGDVVMSPSHRKPPQPKPKAAVVKEAPAKTAPKEANKAGASGKPGAPKI